MPVVTRVRILPYTCGRHGRWDSDPGVHAFLAASRAVFELYSDELAAAGLPGRRRTLWFYVLRTDRRRAHAQVARSHDPGLDDGNLHVPSWFADLAPDDAVVAAADLLDAALLELADAHSWPRGALTALRGRAGARGMRFGWASPAKAAPGRRHRALCRYRIAGDGLGRVQLEVRRRDDEEVVARTAEAVAFTTVEGFRASAATLRWDGPARVTAVPWVDRTGAGEGTLAVDLARPTVEPLVVAPPVRGRHRPAPTSERVPPSALVTA